MGGGRWAEGGWRGRGRVKARRSPPPEGVTAYKKGAALRHWGCRRRGRSGSGEPRASLRLGPGAACRSPGGGAAAEARNTEREESGSESLIPGKKVGHLGAPRNPVSLRETCCPLTRPRLCAGESGAQGVVLG